LLFETTKDGLPYPITPADNYGHIIAHGPHCINEIKSFVAMPPTNDVDKMHSDHCLCLGYRMLDYITNHHEGHFHLPAYMCEDMRKSYLNGNYDYYAWVSWSSVPPANSSEGARLAYATIAQNAGNVEMFALVSGQNLGDLLMKQYNGESLTPIQAAFLAKWESATVDRVGLQALTCMGIDDSEEHVHGHHDVRPVEALVDHGNYHPQLDKLRKVVESARFFKPDSCSKVHRA